MINKYLHNAKGLNIALDSKKLLLSRACASVSSKRIKIKFLANNQTRSRTFSNDFNFIVIALTLS